MLQQTITPGKGIFYAGESITVELANIPDIPGKAVFRSNLYGAGQRRNEIIRHHETGAPFQDLDWHDIEIPGSGATRSVKLPLTDVGIFEGKCCFIPENGSPIIWCQGGNVRFKVTAASSIAGTTIYAAFVRQFGANLYKERTPAEPETLSQLEKEGYNVVVTNNDTALNLIAISFGLKEDTIEAIVTAENGGAIIAIYYCVDTTTANDLEEYLDEKNDDTSYEVDRSGKIVWVGTETAIKDAK